MTSPEFAQVEMLAQVDDLVTQFTHWVERPSAWQSLRSVRLVIQRVLQRVDPLRIRMEDQRKWCVGGFGMRITRFQTACRAANDNIWHRSRNLFCLRSIF